MEGVFIRSRAKWIDEGKKISKYFCNLENRNFVSKHMSQVELNNGHILTNTEDIVNASKEFYEQLYSSKEHQISNTSLNVLLSNDAMPKLNEDEAV